MSYILTPNGRKSIISESKELDETIELDIEHFVEYVMENFPELTEKYIQENYEQVDEISSKLARSYLHKSIKDTDKPHPKGGYRLGDPKERAQFDKKTRRFDSQALAKSKLTGLSNRKSGDDDYVKAKVLTKD